MRNLLYLLLLLSSAVFAAAEVTGTAEVVNGNGTTSSTASITVPADATAVVLFANAWTSGGGHAGVFSINGSSFTTGSQLDVAGGGEPYVGVYYLANPSTGSQTLTWNLGVSATAGGGMFLVYVKGVDTADLVRASATAHGVSGGSVTINPASSTTDLVLAMGVSYQQAPEITSAATSIFNDNNITDHQTDIDVMTAGASTTSIAVTNLNYSGSAGISLKASSGGGSSIIPIVQAHARRRR